MFEVWLTAQIIGGMFIAAGAYMIGNWWLILGIFFIVWGNNMQQSVQKGEPLRPDKPESSWIGD